MKKLTILASLLLLTGNILFAQNKHFTTNGTIDYEKTSNMFAMLHKRITKDNETFYQPIYDQYIKSHPQFSKLKSTLAFADNKTFFNPVVPETASGNNFDNIISASQNNIIFSDYGTSTCIAQKSVFDETFLVKDTIRHIKWKITDETREILGYTCKRANGLILDSVYVVAFYAEEIPVPGGPESFNGLPGMILSVILPHDNVRWDAVKITDMPVDEKALTPPKKGKPVNYKQLKATLLSVMKDWGDYAQQYLQSFSL